MAVTPNPIVPNPQFVHVKTSSGEFLHFTLEAAGPQPIFSFISSDRGTLRDNDTFGAARTFYEWDHLRSPTERIQLERLNLSLAFLFNKTYKYTVDRCDAAGTRIARVLEIEYTGAPTDGRDEAFRVVLQ